MNAFACGSGQNPSREIRVKRICLIFSILLPVAALISGAAALGNRPQKSSAIDFKCIRQQPEPVGLRIDKSSSSRMITSQDGSYLGVQDISGTDQRPQAGASTRFTLYDSEGQELWSLTGSLDTDEPVPSWYISNDGRVVSVRPARSLLNFIDLGGSAERTVELFPDTPSEMERPIACAFSADGQLLAVNALQHHPRPGDEMTPRQKGASHLILFTGRGEELWRRRLEEEISGPVAISDDGNRIAAVALSVMGANRIEMKTHLFDREGQWLAAVATDFRLADFSSDGSRLLLGRKRDLRLVETATGKTIWENRLADEYGQIRATDLSPDGTLALVAAAPSRFQEGRFTFTPVHALIYDDRGQQVWEESFPEDAFDRPAARFLPDGSGFSLALENRCLIYGQE